MGTIKTLYKSLREYKKPTVATLVSVTCEIIIETMIPLVMAVLLNYISVLEDSAVKTFTPILRYGLILLAMAVVSLFFGQLAGRFAARGACGFSKNLRKDIYYKIQDFAFTDIDRFSVPSLVTRMTTDVSNVEQAVHMCIRMAVRVPLMLVFSFAFSVKINWRLSLIFLGAVPVLILCIILLIRKVLPSFIRIFKKYDEMNESVQENVQAIRVVKSFVREDYERSKFERVSGTVRREFTRAEILLALGSPIMNITIYTVIGIIVFIGTRTIVDSGGAAMNVGDLSALINYSIQIMMSIAIISIMFVNLTVSAESARRIGEVLKADSSLVSPPDGIETVPDGEVEFVDVSFKYKAEAGKNALKDINLKIRSGETVGIIGGTGSSKSTLVQLIPRLYDVTEGTVKVGGRDVREYDLKALRHSVAMVLQKNVLFAGTVKENIRWGKEDATDEEIREACRLACADDFVSEMPDGYDTFIEQGGSNVSGGQKQRLCIARAIIRRPKILILDDSTSAVDTRTDAKIRKAFAESIPGTTKIIIAQRIASVQEADKIVVLDEGSVSAVGTHDELLKTSPIYRDVFESQTKSGRGGV